MSEYEQIRVLEMGIAYLQTMRSSITDRLVPAKGDEREELLNDRAALDEKISALIDKRTELVINTSCSIAGVEPPEV